MKYLGLESFNLHAAAFELRHEPAFLHWDRAGAIWYDMAAKFPALKNIQAQPGITVFQIGNSYQLTVELNKLTVRASRPADSLQVMGDLTNRLVEVCAFHLKYTDFLRVGLRTIYHRDYDSLTLATEAFLGLSLIRSPQKAPFVSNGKPTTPEYTLGWENDDVGATVRVKGERRGVQYDVPFGWESSEPKNEERFSLIFDVDYYTKASVALSQLRPSEWMTQAFRTIHRGARDILEQE